MLPERSERAVVGVPASLEHIWGSRPRPQLWGLRPRSRLTFGELNWRRAETARFRFPIQVMYLTLEPLSHAVWAGRGELERYMQNEIWALSGRNSVLG